jgi:hypothetical protein
VVNYKYGIKPLKFRFNAVKGVTLFHRSFIKFTHTGRKEEKGSRGREYVPKKRGPSCVLKRSSILHRDIFPASLPFK